MPWLFWKEPFQTQDSPNLPACLSPEAPRPPGDHSGLSLSDGGPVAISGKPTDLETAGWELKRERGQSQDSERGLFPDLS